MHCLRVATIPQGAHRKIGLIAISARWTRNVRQVGVTDDTGLPRYLVSDWGLNTVAGFSQPCGGERDSSVTVVQRPD